MIFSLPRSAHSSPLESFTIGHTIVLSRGLLDVLPDEASLAMVLAHELSHIVLGHKFDTKLAFNDRMFFADQESFQRLDFKRRPADEEAADTKALELLKNSPYKDKLGTAGLFLKQLQERAPDLPNLIRPHLGEQFRRRQGHPYVRATGGRAATGSATDRSDRCTSARRTHQARSVVRSGRTRESQTRGSGIRQGEDAVRDYALLPLPDANLDSRQREGSAYCARSEVTKAYGEGRVP